VEKLIELDEMKEDGRWGLLSKKEQSKLEKVYRKLSKNLGGIKNMLELPGALFIIDSTKEEIAIFEARKLNIPIVAVVDTNGDPEDIDHPIPGNDDAVRAIELFTSKISEAIIEGKKDRMEKDLLEAKKEEEVSPEEGTTPEEEAIPEEGTTPEEEVVPPEEGQASPSDEKAPSPSKSSEEEKKDSGYTEPEKSA
jgi:small subunit ribosomal protein S2